MLTIVLLVISAPELVAGVDLHWNPHYTGAAGLGLISNLLIASMLIGYRGPDAAAPFGGSDWSVRERRLLKLNGDV